MYADPLGDEHAVRQELTRLGQAHAAAMDVYFASVPAIRAAGDFTACIVPTYSGINVPLEAPHILWQR